MRRKFLLVAMLLGLAACEEQKVADVPPTSDPGKRARMDVVGMKAKGTRVAIGANGAVHWFKAIASGTHLSPASAFPAQVTRIDAEKRCEFTGPKEGALVSVVNLYGSHTDTQIFPTTKELIATNVERLIDRSGDKVLMILGKTAIVNPYEMVDLVITERSAPLHLVLASADQVIWNFVPAEGVEISHVTLLGKKDSGVANLPEGVPVTAFDARMMKKCKIDPAFRPLETWQLRRRSKEHFDKYKLRFARFDAWVRRVHRGYSNDHKVDATTFSHVLIGPPPQTLASRVPYRGIGQSHVRMVSKAPIEIMEKRPYAVKIKSIAKVQAEQMVGMSLSEYGREKNKRKN